MSAADLPVAILAGGLATRLGSITEKIPKLLVEVAGEPFFTHQINLLKKSGLRRIVLCVGHLGEKIRAHYGDGADRGVSITYSFDGEKLLGTGGALVAALPHLGPAFYVLYGDSYLNFDYHVVGDRFLRSAKLGLMTVYRNEDQLEPSNVWLEAGEIRAYDKRRRLPQMRHIDYGLGVFRADAFQRLPRHTPIDLADVQHDLAARHQLLGYEVGQRFYEIGSRDGLKELDALLRANNLPPPSPCPTPPSI
jgi:NDP-sugar pyrophosphorylase family protein